MRNQCPQQKAPPTLEQLLQRDDIWRGHGQKKTVRQVIDTGHSQLNNRLLNNGWPLGSLVEIYPPSMCQTTNSGGEWLLLSPAVKRCLNNTSTYAVLLNPPALPFAQGLSQLGITLEQLLIIRVKNKTDFIVSFVELARASSCSVIMAWQPKQALNYSELRKCQLATANGTGLYFMFRHTQAQQQSSPAALRLEVTLGKENLSLTLLKQRGQLQHNKTQPALIPLPKSWQALLPHPLLTSDKKALQPAAANEPLLPLYHPHQTPVPIRTKKQPLKRRYY